ncbi:MAG: hypothetical protein AAF604_10000 [Acidobacteriota bacterium]
MRRATLGRLAIVFLALALGACSAELLHDIPEDEATRILAVLQHHGIEAHKELDDAEGNRWRVITSRGSAGRAFSLLAEYKLPRVQDRRFQDVFGKSKLVMTPMEEQALYLEALQGEIAHTLESIDGVIDARVHLVRPKVDLAGRPAGQAKASVVVEYQPTSQGLAPIQNVEIQKIVANSVEEMTPELVAVVQKPASIAAPGTLPLSDGNLVKVGALVVEEGTLPTLKGLITLAVLIIAGLGFAVFWQSRMIGELRDELVVERTGLVATPEEAAE